MSTRTRSFWLAVTLTIAFGLALALNDAPRWAILGLCSIFWVLLVILDEVD